MKFQILNILVYGANGQIRSIELKPDAVNVVTGQSKTGKSALIHIVDYCLGRRECNVPARVIRKHVEWYAVKLQTSSGEVFIARRNPEPGKESSEDIYIERGTSLSFPEASSLTKNANLETLASILNQVLGIGEYTHEPKAGQTRKTGTADIGKALFYCFQEQSEMNRPGFSRRSRFSKNVGSRILPVRDRRHGHDAVSGCRTSRCSRRHRFWPAPGWRRHDGESVRA